MTLPTGYGKSLCYAALPVAFDKYRRDSGSIVIVVSRHTDERSSRWSYKWKCWRWGVTIISNKGSYGEMNQHRNFAEGDGRHDLGLRCQWYLLEQTNKGEKRVVRKRARTLIVKCRGLTKNKKWRLSALEKTKCWFWKLATPSQPLATLGWQKYRQELLNNSIRKEWWLMYVHEVIVSSISVYDKCCSESAVCSASK